MILTCPKCATRYFVDDQRLGTSGRTVKCASCGERWTAAAEAALELSAEAGPRVEAAVATGTAETQEIHGDVSRLFRAKVEQQRRTRRIAVATLVWLGLGAGFASLLAAAYVLRVDLVRLAPSAAGAYAAAGIRVNVTGLEFEKIKAEPAPDGSPVVTVTGAVRNVVSEAVAPPPIRVTLVDAKGARLGSTVVRLRTPVVAPGASVAFGATLPDVGARAADVDLSFAPELAPRPARAQPVKTAARRTEAGSSPAPIAKATSAGLRGTVGAPQPGPETAVPLPPDDPLALDTGASGAVSARNG